MTRRLTALVGLLLLAPFQAQAISVRPIAATGVMQQPTSQYYHWIYGGILDVGPTDDLSVRASYFERPAFRSAGYVDQEFLSFLQAGGSISRRSVFDIYGYVGAGRVWGYIKEDLPKENADTAKRETFSMPALALSMEAGISVGLLDLRLGHSMAVCLGANDQIKTKVAWPYSTYYMTATIPVEFGPGSRRGGR